MIELDKIIWAAKWVRINHDCGWRDCCAMCISFTEWCYPAETFTWHELKEVLEARGVKSQDGVFEMMISDILHTEEL